MLKLPCQVLDIPKPSFQGYDRNKNPPGPIQNNGKTISRWKIPLNAQFLSTNAQPFTYKFIVETGFNWKYVEMYLDESYKQIQHRCGFAKANILQLKTREISDLKSRLVIDKATEDAKSEDANLVILLLKNSSIPLYADFEDLADRKHGLYSLCMVKKSGMLRNANNGNIYMFSEHMTNVVMKINLKTGGITQSVGFVRDYMEKNRVMVVGADVVHAGPGAFHGTPSIAAIVGSVDFSAGKCLG
jgi:eukaryotic translation initiation factor 2C